MNISILNIIYVNLMKQLNYYYWMNRRLISDLVLAKKLSIMVLIALNFLPNENDMYRPRQIATFICYNLKTN